MTEEKIPLDPKEWRSWSKSQRQECVQQLRIVTPQMRRLWNEFDTAVQLSRQLRLPDPYIQFLTGVPGTGKTTLVRMWRERAAPDVSSLYAAIPAPGSVKSLITACLAALGDPEPWRGITGQMEWRLIETIKATETRIVFLDELQCLIDKTGSPASVRTIEHVLSFINTLTRELNLPLVLIGLPEAANVLLQSSPQLTSRMQAPRQLGLFTWDFSRPETNTDFRNVLHTIDQFLPLDWSGLGTEEMAARFFLATDGNLRRLMRLIRAAAHTAIEEDATTLSLEGLAQAYEQVTANGFLGERKPDPFRDKPN